MALIGIDLGTSNSLISVWRDGEAQLIKNSVGNTLTPSVVSIDDKGQILVGEIAKHRLITHPKDSVAEFKRYMGTNKSFSLGQKTLRAEELSALVLKSLIADAEAELDEKIDSAVISVPAYFSDAQRKATRDAGRLAGIEVKRLINEPTAAAIAYGLHEKNADTTFLVFDIGGGTFDVSILELFDQVMQVNSTAGDNRLGGEDFLNAMVDHVLASHKLSPKKITLNELAQLRSLCEKAKCKLTNEKNVSFNFTHRKKELTIEWSRQDFEKITADLLSRLRLPLERALKDADIHGDDLDAVVLVGGASRMPIIRSMVSKMLGKIPRSHMNPDEIVALGAAVQAALIDGDKSLAEVVMTDVAPYTLGVGVVNESGFYESGNLFHPIIDRNSPVPISRVDTLWTASDFQTTLEVTIYQGESRLVKDNIRLGSLSLKIPKARKGEESIDVRFTYDISGLLEVEASVKSTGESYKAVIEGNPGSLTEKEIEEKLARLNSLKIHPREDAENALLLARGEHLYEISRGDLREYIGEIMSRFEKILQSQVVSEIEQSAIELSSIFDGIEKDTPIQ